MYTKVFLENCLASRIASFNLAFTILNKKLKNLNIKKSIKLILMLLISKFNLKAVKNLLVGKIYINISFLAFPSSLLKMINGSIKFCRKWLEKRYEI